MKRKIFLTSVIALAVASPAFADTWPYGYGYNVTDGTGWIAALNSAGGSAVTAANCQATPLTIGGESPTSGTFTFTASWSPNRYKVIYTHNNSCAGDGSTDEYNSNTDTGGALYGQNYTIKGMGASASGVTEPAGYHFVSWVGTSGGNVVVNDNPYPYNNLTEAQRTYTETQTITPYGISGDLTLTASCAANDYDVIYAAGTGCSGGSTDEGGATFGESYTIKGIGTGTGKSGVTTNEGYHFTKWVGTSSDSNYTSADYTETGSFTYNVVGNLTLTAQCDGNDYTVTYVCTGNEPSGTGTASYKTGYTTEAGHTQTFTYGSTNNGTAALNVDNVCSLPGSNPTGWACVTNTNPPVSVDIDANTGGNTWSVANDVTCTALWNANQINLRWLKETGDTTPYTTGTCVYGNTTSDAHPITVPAPTKEGHTFNGWIITDHDN